MMRKQLLLMAETPLTPSTGMGAGEVDLPVQRDPATGLPAIRGSTIKGALRHYLIQEERNFVEDILGSPEKPSKISFGDARLVALPVPSTSQFMVWITSPLLLRYIDPTSPNENPKCVCWEADSQGSMYVDFLGYRVRVSTCPNSNSLYACQTIERIFPSFLDLKLLVVSDAMVRPLVDMGLGRRTRIEVGSEGVASSKKLWVEEYIQPYSILHMNLFLLDESVAGLLERLFGDDGLLMTLGGSKSIGSGVIRLSLLQEVKDPKDERTDDLGY